MNDLNDLNNLIRKDQRTKKDADGPPPERSGDSRRQMARIGLIFTDL